MAEQSFLTMPMSYLLKVCNDLFSVLFVSRFMKWINCFAKNFFCCCCCCCCCRRCCCIFSRCCYLRWWWRRCCCSCLCCRWLRCRWFEQVGSNGIDWCCARRNIIVKSGDVSRLLWLIGLWWCVAFEVYLCCGNFVIAIALSFFVVICFD